MSNSQNKQPLLWKEVDEAMTKEEMAAVLIEHLRELQRIEMAPDRDKEIRFQMKTVLARLEALGIVTENLMAD